MIRARLATLVAALTLTAAPGLAQQTGEDDEPLTAQSPQGDEIVVIGERIPEKRINTYIHDIILPERSGGGWKAYLKHARPLCPIVVGLQEPESRLMRERMERVARVAGINVAEDDDCTHNLVLAVVDDGPETIRRWRSKYQRRAFGLIPIQTRDFIMNGSGPAYAWHVIDAAISLQNEGVGLVPGGLGGAGGGVVPFVGSYAFSTGGGDIAQHPRSATFRESIEAAFVVIEHTALKGVSATQLADYALMHGMLQVQRDRGASLGADSILSLFDVASATDAPPSLTRLDLALLVSLYSTRPGLGEYRQRRAMIEPFQRVMAYGEEGIEREGD